jgi:peptidoglycan hydrolase-like protein with peptidoglycan-binding domain
VGQTPLAGTWLTYPHAAGEVALAPAADPGPTAAAAATTATALVAGTTTTVTTAAVGQSARIVEAQQRLADLGYDPGEADGVLGPRTRAAVTAFQKDKGLSATGRINEVLLETLRAAQNLAASTPARPGAA